MGSRFEGTHAEAQVGKGCVATTGRNMMLSVNFALALGFVELDCILHLIV